MYQGYCLSPYTQMCLIDHVGTNLRNYNDYINVLQINKKLIGMGFTTGGIPTGHMSTLLHLKIQNCPQMSVLTRSHTLSYTHTHTHTLFLMPM